MLDKQFRRWGDINPPCRDCPDRCVGCHGQEPNGLYKCSRYGEFKAQRADEYAVRKEFIRLNDEVAAIHRHNKYRNKGGR